jgi:hypothetical protein
MTDAEKLTVIKTLLDDGGEMPSDEKLNTYIQIAGQEILAWKYHLIGGVPEDVTEVPAAEDISHIYAVVAGYTHAGSEGEKQHNENSVNRVFIYADMVDYIRNNVLPYVRVGAVT